MDVKKKFGEYLTLKRKAADFTQQELADRLYVTKTAVSKWERGLSYPDITLVKSICENLNITAEEFINASDDLATRKFKKESQYYKRTATWYHAFTLGSYGLALLITLILNLTIDKTLSWFIIVLPSILLSASLTNLPFLHRHVPEKYHERTFVLQYTLPLLFLYLILLATGIYNSLDWLLTAYLGILLAYSILILPIFLKKLNRIERRTRLLFVYTTPLVVLLLLLLYTSIIYEGDWFLVSSLGVLAGYEIFLLPHIFDQISPYTKKHNFLLTLGAVFVTLLILFIVV